MSIFPEITIPASKNEDSVRAGYTRELAFDFNVNEFIIEDGKPRVLEGKEALKIWIEKAIRTARYRFLIYSSDYGCELEDIIGLDISRPVLESEIERIIREALVYDRRIEDVRDFVIERGADWLNVSFRVISVWGDEWTQEVITGV